MKNSIRTKLFIHICLLILFFIFLSWALNLGYLEKYYITEKEDILKETQKKINRIYQGNPEEIAIDLERIENTIGASIVILDKDMEVEYSSFSRILNRKPFNRRPANLNNLLERTLELLKAKNNMVKDITLKEKIEGEYFFRIQRDAELKVDFLELISWLDRGELLLLRVPLVSISESVKVANDFVIFTGMLVAILGALWAYVFSNRFTKPILDIHRVAEHVANLDFSKKCVVKGEDEIGRLGKSINYLSEKLDNTISELNQKNERLSREIEKERKIDEMRKQFISNVSHELRTPISLIQGYAEGLRESVIDDEENKNYYCEVIVDEANKMDRLVKDLMNLSQFESGFSNLERGDFDLSSLVKQTLNKYQSIFDKKGIRLELHCDEMILVNGDMVKIEQVLVNYLNNGLNHVDDKKQIGVKVLEKEEKAKVSIFNSGKHIPASSLGKIWTSFYKVDEARTREYGGYGLGLSIVRAIQEMHHNGFGVENVEGGVTFWFELDKSKDL